MLLKLKDKSISNYIKLLKAHRAIVIQQLIATQKIVNALDLLLEPHDNNSAFQINNRVVSNIAPNKNKIGLGTNVTESFIHVAPLDTKLSPYKKPIRTSHTISN